MRFIDYFSHISADFLSEESGASFIEHVLLVSLVATVLTLCLLALNKDS